MIYLVDATFAIDVLTRQPYAEAFLDGLLSDGFALSIFTYMELWEGVYTSREPRRARQGLEAFLAGVHVLPFSRRIARQAARLRGELRGAKRPIQHRAIDILIAATALHYQLTMVTSDRDYDDIPNLRRLNPRVSR